MSSDDDRRGYEGNDATFENSDDDEKFRETASLSRTGNTQHEYPTANEEGEEEATPKNDNEPFESGARSDDGSEEPTIHNNNNSTQQQGAGFREGDYENEGDEEEEETEGGEEEEEDEETDGSDTIISEEEIIVDEANSRLYELLQVDPSVPAHQIYNTFKHLTLRDQYKMAFNILSDPHTKRVYDIGGESSVDHLESKAFGPFISVAGSTVSMVVYGLFWICVTVFLSLFFIFLMLHVDKWEGSGTWTWTEVLVPLYILAALGVAGSIALTLAAIVAPANKDAHIISYRAPAIKIIVTAGYLAFLVLADRGIASDDPYGKPWMGYFAILIVVDVLSIIDWMLSRYPAKVRKTLEPTSEKPLTEKEAVVGRRLPNKQPADLVYGYMIIGIFDIVVAVARGVFLGLKIDGTIDWSWYIVVIPIALRLVSSVFFRLHQARIQHFIGQRGVFSVIMGFLGTCIMNGLMIASVFLIAYFIESPEHTTMVEALVPIYVVLAYLVAASIFTAVYVLVANYRVIALEKEEAKGIRAAQKAFGVTPSIGGSEDSLDNAAEDGHDSPVVQHPYNAGNDPFENSHHGEPVSSLGTESVLSAETIVEEMDEEDDNESAMRAYGSPISHLTSDRSGGAM